MSRRSRTETVPIADEEEDVSAACCAVPPSLSDLIRPVEVGELGRCVLSIDSQRDVCHMSAPKLMPISFGLSQIWV